MPSGPSSGRLDLQPLLDRITSLTGEGVTLKHDMDEEDKCITELGAKLRASEEILFRRVRSD